MLKKQLSDLAEETPSLGLSSDVNETVLKREDLENTPFTLISLDDGVNWFGCMGEYRITEPTNNKQSLIDDLITPKDWNRLIQVFLILLDKSGNLIEYKTKNNNK